MRANYVLKPIGVVQKLRKIVSPVAVDCLAMLLEAHLPKARVQLVGPGKPQEKLGQSNVKIVVLAIIYQKSVLVSILGAFFVKMHSNQEVQRAMCVRVVSMDI